MLPHLPAAAVLLSLAALAVAEEPAPAPPPAPAAERATLPPRSEAQARQLARQYEAQAQWLNAGGESFLALWQPANAPEARGVVILLPSEGQHADWPRGIGPLRSALPDHDWSTLSLSLPDPEPAPWPEPALAELKAAPTAEPEVSLADPATEEAPTENTEPPAAPEPAPEPEEVAAPEPMPPPAEEPPAEQGAAAEAPPEVEAPLTQPERIAARIEAALDFVAAQGGGPVMLVGQGTGAYWAVRFKADNAVAQVARLGLIVPHQPAAERLSLNELLADTRLPVGDFYYREGIAKDQAKSRHDLSVRHKHPAYHQVGLTPIPADRAVEQAMLVKRVRGWLDRQQP